MDTGLRRYDEMYPVFIRLRSLQFLSIFPRAAVNVCCVGGVRRYAPVSQSIRQSIGGAIP